MEVLKLIFLLLQRWEDSVQKYFILLGRKRSDINLGSLLKQFEDSLHQLWRKGLFIKSFMASYPPYLKRNKGEADLKATNCILDPHAWQPWTWEGRSSSPFPSPRVSRAKKIYQTLSRRKRKGDERSDKDGNVEERQKRKNGVEARSILSTSSADCLFQCQT